MIITIEPGCYFSSLISTRFAKELNIPLDSVDMEKIKEYQKEVSGVRIEDDVLVTDTGSINLVKVPRTVEEIEKCMAGKDWK